MDCEISGYSWGGSIIVAFIGTILLGFGAYGMYYMMTDMSNERPVVCIAIAAILLAALIIGGIICGIRFVWGYTRVISLRYKLAKYAPEAKETEAYYWDSEIEFSEKAKIINAWIECGEAQINFINGTITIGTKLVCEYECADGRRGSVSTDCSRCSKDINIVATPDEQACTLRTTWKCNGISTKVTEKQYVLDVALTMETIQQMIQQSKEIQDSIKLDN